MEQKSYIICSTVRSGSTLLCKTLEKLEGCGQPKEYFHRHILKKLKLNNNPDKFLSYCQSIWQEGLSHHGTLGIKMHWWQMLDFLSIARQSPDLENKQDWEILNIIFPNSQFIYLWRREIMAQAVSAAIAMQTGQWEKVEQNETEESLQKEKKLWHNTVKSPKFQPWKIYEWEKSLEAHNLGWRKFFQDNSLPYYEITYEDMIESFTEQIINLVDYLGIDTSQISSQIAMPTQRQFNKVNRQFIDYYKLLPKPLLEVIYLLYARLKTRMNEVV